MKEEEFNRFLVREYFKHGSVEGALRAHKYDVPVSYATYQRVLGRYKVIKAVGPNNKLTEVLEFIEHMTKDNVSFEDVYKKIPPRFQTSISTLYRILGYMRQGLTRRVGVGLIVTPHNNEDMILLAEDVSTPRIELGKPYGSISIPMGYARKRDTRAINILRILQSEVFTDLVINESFPQNLVPSGIEPFMYLDVVDVRVAVYHLQLPKDLSSTDSFSSFKLRNYRFLNTKEILKENKLRAGVKEAVSGYKKYLSLLERNLVVNPIQAQSFLNRELATVTLDLQI